MKNVENEEKIQEINTRGINCIHISARPGFKKESKLNF